MMVRLARANKSIALAVVINEPKLVEWIKAASPNTIVMYRHTTMPKGPHIIGDPERDRLVGQKFFRDYWPLLAQAPQADYFSFCNEWLPNSGDKPPDFITEQLFKGGMAAYHGIMDAANTTTLHGKRIKITVGDLNVGHPHPDLYKHLTPMLARAQKLGYALKYHAYTDPRDYDPTIDADNRAFRWLKFTPVNMPVIIGEYGPDRENAAFPGPDNIMKLISLYEDMLRRYPQVIGYGLWAETEAHSWSWSDVTPALGKIEHYLMS